LLNTYDKHFVQLFETPEYSKLRSEVSALPLNLKGNFKKQTEKAMEKVPIVNRTETDELYKSI